jgi:ADP-ribose pyrophosphatase YjhB (NUDIX family)
MSERGPRATVDVIIERDEGIVLIERRNPPHGWAIPGGFVDEGERAEDAARREMREETSLEVELTALLGVYSDPARDPRGHTISTVYVGRGRGTPRADDDAAGIGVFRETELPQPLAFDHARILADYFHFRRTGERPRPA